MIVVAKNLSVLQLFISSMPKMCAILQLVSAPLNPIYTLYIILLILFDNNFFQGLILGFFQGLILGCQSVQRACGLKSNNYY